MVERDIPTIGVDIYTPDFIAIAKGFGCDAKRDTGTTELTDALHEAVAADRPTLIEIPEELALGWQSLTVPH
jgi:acetolactate synthase I/II/III large subunit